MNSLTDIEQKYNFQFPEIYQHLSENKMLNWGETGPDWYLTVFPQLKSNPPLLLFGNDIEIWNNDQLVKASIEEMSDEEDYRNIHSAYRFVPFAKNEAGDLYVFQLDLQNGKDIPVTFIPHDDEEAEIVSKNFQDFIFRQLLEAVVEIDEDAMFYEDEEDNLKQNLFNLLRTHESYLTTKQIEILHNIYQRDIFEYTYKVPNGHIFEAEGLASFDEVPEILNRGIAFDKLNKKFNYTECLSS